VTSPERAAQRRSARAEGERWSTTAVHREVSCNSPADSEDCSKWWCKADNAWSENGNLRFNTLSRDSGVGVGASPLKIGWGRPVEYGAKLTEKTTLMNKVTKRLLECTYVQSVT